MRGPFGRSLHWLRRSIPCYRSLLLANAPASGLVDGQNLGRGQGGVVDGHVVDETGEGAVLVYFLADGEPVDAGVGDGPGPVYAKVVWDVANGSRRSSSNGSPLR